MKTLEIIPFIALIIFGYLILVPKGFSMSEGDKLSNQAIINFASEMKEKRDLSICGIGGGEHNGIWLFTVAFDRHDQPMDRDQARKLIIECSEDLIAKVNENIELRPHLRDFPISESNIYLIIYCKDPNGKKLYDPDVSVVSCHEGNISYATYDINKEYGYKSDIDETYKDALEILKKQEEMNK